MSIIDFAEAAKAAIEAGVEVEGNVVRVITSDGGQTIGGAVVKTITGGNGTGATIYSMTDAVIQEGAVVSSTATATGVAFMAVSVPTFFSAVAPALGVAAGVGLYEIGTGDTDFHNRLFSALKDEGKTIGGKVIAYFNGDNIGFDKETVETLKEKLCEINAFNRTRATENMTYDQILYSAVPVGAGTLDYVQPNNPPVTIEAVGSDVVWWNYISGSQCVNIACSKEYFYLTDSLYHQQLGATLTYYNGNPIYYAAWPLPTRYDLYNNCASYDLPSGGSEVVVDYIVLYGDSYISDFLQDDATYPDPDREFPYRYPTWVPWEYPIQNPQTELPDIYPVKYPATDPDPYPSQQPAQNPSPEEVPETYPKIIPDLPLPETNPEAEPEPEPQPEPDPDPQPTPEPITPPTPEPGVNPDPIDPNPEDPINPNPPDPQPIPPIPIVPDLPSTVDSNKLFTVYNPTSSQLDQLGGYLWDDSLIETLKKIWQNPLDGIISLIQVYCTPVTGGSSNIILGYLDSGVSAAVVTDQFVTIECGEVKLNETNKNATDYSPYTELHLYLPFIGIVELDINEFMAGKVRVIYHIDVYTGTCLAEVICTREKDMPSPSIIYTFSGNCSQQLPLTSGDARGMLSALLNGASAALSVASGGSLGVVAGLSMAGHSLSHEMLHVSHSGNISANAGIMGKKKPYLILSRRRGYDANGYNSYYGYPANKTIYLNNTTGFVKVKEILLQVSCTEPERKEILDLLHDGIII